MRRAVAAGGALVFLLSCLLVQGGLLDAHRYGDAALYGHYAHEMTGGRWPYRDFFDEYPAGAQPLFLLVRVLPGSFVGTFRWVMALCGVAALLLLVRLLRRASLPHLLVATAVAACSPLLVGPVFLNTYDLVPALLTVAAVVAWTEERDRTTWILLALAVAVKVFAIVLVPFVLLEAWERGALRRAATWLAGALVLVHLPFAVMGPGGLRFSYWLQIRRGLEVESLAGGALLVLHRLGLVGVTLKDEAPGSRDVVGAAADGLAALSSLVVLAAVVAVFLLYRRGARDRVLAAAAAVTGFVAFAKVLSPQYVAWLVPLVPATGIAAVRRLARPARARDRHRRRAPARGGARRDAARVGALRRAARLGAALGRRALVVDRRAQPPARRALRAARRQVAGGSHTEKSPLTTRV